ncbi:MAG: O-antigen ligase family protein [Parcubacteria group bacterium]|nr:O-antigen ligase family protein [Parcubacteria group bacterium]
MSNISVLNPSKFSREIVYTIFATVFVSVFVLVNLFYGFNLYLYVFCLLFASFFIFKKPEVGLYLIIICTAIFERFFTLQSLTINENTYKLYPLDLILLVTFVSFVFSWWQRPRKKLVIGSVGIGILVFILFCLISFAFGLAQGGDTNDAFSTLKNYAFYAVLYFLIVNIINNRARLDRLVKIFLFCGLALFFFIFYGLIHGSGLWIEYTPLSTFGTRLLAPTHAFYLSIIILLSINLLAYKRNYFGNLAIPIILVQILGVIGSLTRHLWLALGVGVLFSFLFLSRSRKKNLLKIVAIQLFLLIIVLSLYVWFDYIISGQVPAIADSFIKATAKRLQSFSVFMEDESASFRILAWKEAWQSFRGSPLIGIGFGHKLSFDYFGYPARIQVRNLHNNFIGIALQMGILGFLSFISFNLLFIRRAYRKLKTSNSYFHPYLLGFFACYLAFLLSANFGIYFDINLLVIFFWIILGTIVALDNIKQPQEKRELTAEQNE